MVSNSYQEHHFTLKWNKLLIHVTMGVNLKKIMGQKKVVHVTSEYRQSCSGNRKPHNGFPFVMVVMNASGDDYANHPGQ